MQVTKVYFFKSVFVMRNLKSSIDNYEQPELKVLQFSLV